jgi:WD40 repeat protein
VLECNIGLVMSLLNFKDERLVVVGGENQTECWDLIANLCHFKIPNSRWSITGEIINEHKKIFAIGKDNNNKISFWDAKLFKKLLVFKGHLNEISVIKLFNTETLISID